MARIYHFDIQVQDIDRAVAFYSSAFGWDIQKWDGPMEYWLVMTGPPDEPGIDGGISVGEANLTSGQLTMQVQSLDEVVGKVKEAGGEVVRERSALPGVGWLAEVRDPDGNVFGLMEEDESAK